MKTEFVDSQAGCADRFGDTDVISAESARILERDLMVLVARLVFEDDLWHTPETREVLNNWRGELPKNNTDDCIDCNRQN